MTNLSSQPRPSDRWIPWCFVAFFVVLVSTLVPMGILAVRTNTGLVTNGAYEKGLAYNKSIQAEAQQDALKWRGEVTLAPPSGDKVQADFLLNDSEGKSLEGADVKIWLVRPTQAGKDQTVVMQAHSAGHYSAELTLPEHGLWEARVSATLQGHNYQVVKRVVFP